jgi:hypothetical protein
VAGIRPGSVSVLPDSRLRDRLKGVVRGFLRGIGFINWVPIFCANCGKANGYVPEENMRHVFWLCDQCEKWASEAGLMAVPDEVFWQQVREEQLEKYGRLLSPSELITAAESTTTPLSKLLRDRG